MRFDLDDAYKYKNRPFHSATPLFHAPNLLLFLNYFSRTVEDGLEPLKTFVSRVCRVKRMTCRLKSDYGSSVVRPCSLRKVLRVI